LRSSGFKVIPLFVVGLIFMSGCSNQPPPQTVATPTTFDQERLTKQRAVIEKFLADDASRAKYATAAGKLGTLRELLQRKQFAPSQTYELQCMGIVLGDAFVQKLGMEWVTVTDEHGSDPAVRLPGTSLIIYPLTMISKRVERGEAVDIFDLFNGIADQIDELKKKGY
jgi:Domain of unknown function (DUF3806)